MRLIFLMVLSLCVVSCSDSKSRTESRSKNKKLAVGNVSAIKLTQIELEAQSEARTELSELPEKFAIDDSEINSLLEEGLLTEEELAALKIAQ